MAQVKHPCNIHFEGDVLDIETNSPLEYTTIKIKELNLVTQTDFKGYFEIKDICPGNYTMQLSLNGYEPITFTIVIQSNLHKDVFLSRSQNILNTIQVASTKKTDLLNSNSNKLSQKDLDKKAGENLGTILKQLPGLNTLNTGAGISKPVITGLHSIRVVTINDGVKLEGQQWGAEHAPEIDANSASIIQVEKGAGALQYSNEAIGGLIIIKPAPLRSLPGWNASINTNISTVNLRGGISGMFEGQLKKTPGWSWRIQGTLNKAGNTKTPTYYLKNTGYEERDLNCMTSYHKNKWKLNASYKIYHQHLGVFAGAHIGNLTDLLIAFKSPEPIDSDGFRYRIKLPSQKINHQTISFGLTYQINTRNKLDFNYSFQFNKRQEFDKILGRDKGIPAIEFYLNTHGVGSNWHFVNNHATYVSNLGLNGQWQNNYYSGSYFIPEYNQQSIGIYSIHKITIKRLSVEAGIRFDSKWQEITRMKQKNVHLKHQWMGIAANIGAIYQFDSHLSIDFQTGTSWRAPHAIELYSEGVHHGAASFEKGNSTLKVERVYNVSINMTYSQGDLYQAQITVYNKYIKNFIYLQPRTTPVLTIRGAFPAFDYKQTDANFKGVDLYFKIKLGKGFDITEKTSILYAKDLKNKNYLTLIPPNKIENSLGYTFPIHKKIDDCRIGINTTYVARQNLVENNQDLIPVPKAYFLIGLEGSFEIKTTKEPIQIYVEVDNLFNKQYRDYMNRWRYFANEAGTNFSLRVKIPLSSKD
jgi:iron complex outermembrane receptor protein